jgi:hypothetical protein
LEHSYSLQHDTTSWIEYQGIPAVTVSAGNPSDASLGNNKRQTSLWLLHITSGAAKG